VKSKIHITPDRKRLILGIDWLTKQGRYNWDFDRGQIKFGDENWIELQRERVVHHRRGKFGQKNTVHERSESSLLTDYSSDR